MKNFILSICLLFAFAKCFSQNNDYVFFTENNENVTVYVNNIKQNSVPEANVKAININGDFINVKVEYENNIHPAFSKNYYTDESNMEITLKITQNNKGNGVLRYVTSVARQTSSTVNHSDNGNYEHVYETEDVTFKTTNTESSGKATISDSETVENISFNMNVSENGISINANTNEGNVGINMNVSGTVTTENSQNMNISTAQDSNPDFQRYPPQSPNHHQHQTNYDSGCRYPMQDQDFTEAIESIKEKSFEDSKLTIAKQICKNSCLTCEQITKINKVLTYESSRLEFAKFAYDYAFDKAKYFKINESFTYEASINELNEYIESKNN